MAKSLQELGLKDEPLPATSALDDLPEFGGFRTPPQPGPFRFKLPADLSHAWDLITTEKGQRVSLILDEHAPLQIIQSLGSRYNGEPFHTRLTNNERNRGSNVVASDLHYLLKAFGEKAAPATNTLWIKAVSAQAGKEFGADISYNYSCNPNRNKRVADGSGQVIETNEKGCGWRYYSGEGQMNANKKIGYVGKQGNGEYPTEVQCQCGAVLRAFGNLDNLRA
jgi:hypothetical protein